MTQTASSTGPLFIGVIGKTWSEKEAIAGKVIPEVLNEAFKVGRLLAEAGAVVVTGGHELFPEKSVKYGAIEGALNEQSASARVVGIVPKSIAGKTKIADSGKDLPQDPGACRVEGLPKDSAGEPGRVYLYTGLNSSERNPIMARLVDAIIVLYGGQGTLQELTHVVNFSRPKGTVIPVVYLGAAEVCKRLVSHTGQTPIEANDPEDAVKKVLVLALAARTASGPPPGIAEFNPTWRKGIEIELDTALKALAQG